jgi:hypothetical protein
VAIHKQKNEGGPYHLTPHSKINYHEEGGKTSKKPSVEVHIFNPSAWETEARES